MPGKATAFLRAAELESVERATPDHGVTVRRGLDCSLPVTTVSFVPHQLRQPGHCPVWRTVLFQTPLHSSLREAPPPQAHDILVPVGDSRTAARASLRVLDGARLP
ncbi:hypothetical protein ACH4GK_23445 [Streptomyces rimosus]|uniref:hypothetical protein n=1 Tax=Streptomyces rimosus TaxID=1927 RepID=UPI0004CBEC39|nr:hypothetical protein [Streptomyces rimosus]